MFPIKSVKLSKYFFIIAFLVVLCLSFFIVKPFIRSILTAIVIAYIFYGAYNWIFKKLRRRNLSALLVTILIVLIIVVPMGFVINKLVKEATLTYVTVKQILSRGSVFNIDCDSTKSIMCALSTSIQSLTTQPRVMFYIDQTLNKIITYVSNSASDFLFALPRHILDLFIVFFIVFYLLRDGKELVARIGNWLPIKTKYKAHIIKEFKEVMWGVVYGTVLVAFIQGAVGGFGFFIFGLILYKLGGVYSAALLGGPIVWGLIMALFAMIPFLGTPVVWLPIALIQLVRGFYENNLWLVGIGIGLLLYGTFVVSTIDNLIKPLIIGSRTRVHPALIILGVFGGLLFFGFIGIIIGPIILGMLATFIKIYEKERNQLLDL